MSVNPGQDQGGYAKTYQPDALQQDTPQLAQPAQPMVPQYVPSTNVVVVQQPSAPAPASNPLLIGLKEGNREWSSGLMDCFQDSSVAFKVIFCYSCTVSEVTNRVGEHCCVPYIVPNALLTLRTRIRTLGGIRGSMVGDCCAISWFPQCALCQMVRELQAMGL